MPHALFLNRVYPPVEGATGDLLAELAEHLVGEGWRVTVATGACAGEPRDSVRGGVRVLRAAGGPTLVRKQGGRAGTFGRALDYVRQYPGLAAAGARMSASASACDGRVAAFAALFGGLAGANR